MEHLNDRPVLLRGLPASAGIVEANVFVYQEGEPLAALDQFKSGDILVTHITDPTMVHAMIKASGIITNIGGITSHPAILSREMGIPCVVNTGTATEQLQTGQRVLLDAYTGQVYALD